MNIYQLPEIESISNFISICELNDIKIMRIQHPKLQAAVSLHGGHLISFKPEGKEDVIWVSEKAIYASSAAIRGGTPVCFPWFAKHGTPSHGFARNSEWQIDEHSASENGVTLSLTLSESEETQSIWPHFFFNKLTFIFSDSLEIHLTTTNTDVSEWTFSGALHTYFNIGAIDQVSVSGAGSKFLDSTNASTECEDASDVTFDGEVDRIYYAPTKQLTIKDSILERDIKLLHPGANSAVIWNPGPALSASMADMADNSYQTMVCVESCVRGEVPVTLQPGESYTLSQIVHL